MAQRTLTTHTHTYMSHIEEVFVTVTDLKALKAACERMGVEFRENQKTYRWYGHRVGSEPIPGGFTAEELGKCEHAIHVPGVNYEVGVVPKKDGKGYALLVDFWGSSDHHDGMKLKKRFGDKLTKLVDTYSVEALKAKARAKGYLTQEKTVGGKTHLVVTGF